MKASELRIGNWVMDEHSEMTGKIDLVVIGIIDTVDDHSYLPIPLTEEWLKRFDWNLPKDMSISSSLTTGEIHFVTGNYYKKIDYVHQLQNLYHALTGEELKEKQRR